MAKTTAAPQAGLSLKPEDQEAGGFLDDVDVTIKEMRFVMWDYNGGIDDDAPMLRVTLTTEDGEEREEHYSAGATDKVKPSPDGLRILPVEGSTSKGLKKTTKAALFIKSVCASGFDTDKIEDTVDCFEGTRAHVNQKPYTGFGSKEGSTILLVTKVLGEEKAAGKGGKAGAKAKGNGIADKADATILKLLGGNNNKLSKSKLSTLVFRELRKDADVKAVTELALDEDYLAGEERPFDYDGDTILARE